MSGLLSTRSARRRGMIYVALLATALLLMAFSSAGPLVELQRGVGFAFKPIQSSLTGMARSVSSFVDAIGSIDQLRSRNQELELENQQLKADSQRIGEVERENEQLTALLQLRSGVNYKTVAAQVIGRDPTEFRRTVSIDVGTDHGIQTGDVVIAAGGALAGRVSDVGSNFANVLLISDTGSTVIGQDQSNAATGEVVGQLIDTLVMQDIDSTAHLQIGEEVVTAGIELSSGVRSAFPKGLLIGTIVDVSRDANAVTQTAYVQAAANLDRLEYVLVITGYQGGLPAIGGPSASPGASSSDGGGLYIPTAPTPAVPSPSPTPSPRRSPTPRPSG